MTIDDVKRLLVVGAGQMGSQIAMQAALHGYARGDLGRKTGRGFYDYSKTPPQPIQE